MTNTETIFNDNKDFIQAYVAGKSITYFKIAIPGDSAVHMLLNYDQLLYKGGFFPEGLNYEQFGNLLCQLVYYCTELNAARLEGSVRFSEMLGALDAIVFVLETLGMPSTDIDNIKNRLAL